MTAEMGKKANKVMFRVSFSLLVIWILSLVYVCSFFGPIEIIGVALLGTFLIPFSMFLIYMIWAMGYALTDGFKDSG